MRVRSLVYVTPHALRTARFPTRPGQLLKAFAETGAFDRIVVVNRVRPDRWLRSAATDRRGGRVRWHGPWAGLVWGGIDGLWAATPITLVEHPWPYGRLENELIIRLVEAVAAGGPATLWVADPKSATVFAHLDKLPVRQAFDAYDAWDLSPLVRGRRRIAAVRAGYAVAAARADVVFANTRWVWDRLSGLGARRAVWLPNACGYVQVGVPSDEPYLAYVGRIHERFDSGLVLVVADALASAEATFDGKSALLRIAGPVEREPTDWSRVATHPAVRLEGPLSPARAERLVSGARGLLVPHTRDAYTRSQDTMKAWDAVAAGVPVISTSVPPAEGWPDGLAVVADDAPSFVAASLAALSGALDGSRERRLEFARVNQWRDRANAALDALAGNR